MVRGFGGVGGWGVLEVPFSKMLGIMCGEGFWRGGGVSVWGVGGSGWGVGVFWAIPHAVGLLDVQHLQAFPNHDAQLLAVGVVRI